MADTTLHVDMVLRDFLSREISKAEGSFTKSIRRMGASSEGFRGALGKLRGSFGTLSGAVAIFAGSIAADYVLSLFKSNQKTEEFANQIAYLSNRFGIATKDLEKFTEKLKKAGISEEDSISIKEHFIRAQRAAIKEIGLERIALDELRVNFKNADGSARDFTETSEDAIRALRGFQEGENFGQIVETLFGLKGVTNVKKLEESISSLSENTKKEIRGIVKELKSLDLDEDASLFGSIIGEGKKTPVIDIQEALEITIQNQKKQAEATKESEQRQRDLNSALEKYSELLQQTDIEIIEDPLRRVNKEFEIQKQKLEEVMKLYPELRGVLEALTLNLNTLQDQQFKSIVGENGFLGPNLELSGSPQEILKKLGQFTGAEDGKEKEKTPFEKKLDFLKSQMINTFQEGSLEAAQAIGDNLVSALDRVGQEGENLRDIMKDLVRSILRDLQHIAVQQLVLRAIVGLGGSISGGAAGGPATVAAKHGGVISGSMGKPVKFGAYAQGGIAKGPTLALFGEGPEEEAFVPLKGGAIPVRIAGSKSGMTVNIYAYDSDGFDRLLMRRKRTFNAMMQEIIASNAPTRQQIRSL